MSGSMLLHTVHRFVVCIALVVLSSSRSSSFVDACDFLAAQQRLNADADVNAGVNAVDTDVYAGAENSIGGDHFQHFHRARGLQDTANSNSNNNSSNDNTTVLDNSTTVTTDSTPNNTLAPTAAASVPTASVPTPVTTASPPSCEIDPDYTLPDHQGDDHGIDLRMMARQTRGIVKIHNQCQFEVQRLEVAVSLSSSNNNATIQLDWYAAVSLDETEVLQRTFLARGGIFDQDNLLGNATSGSNSTSNNNPFLVDADLAKVGALLLCETITTSDDGVTTTTTRVLASALLQKLTPGPAADLLAPQPTIFDNCLSLSSTVRLRWSIVTAGEGDTDNNDNSTTTTKNDYLDVGLEYIASYNDAAGTWMAFGPALPGVQDRLMGGSDVVLGGFRSSTDDNDSDGIAFAEDYYIGGYQVCTELTAATSTANATYDGVCRDSVWTSNNDENNDDDDSGNIIDDEAELLYSHVTEGVAFVRIRRPLLATTPEFDHDILPGTKQHFVWGRGPLDEAEQQQGSRNIAEVQFHGYQFGQLKDLDMGEPTWSCPPLEGLELDGSDADVDDDEASLLDDAFAQKFEQRTVLVGNVMEVFWTLLPETSQIHIGARAKAASSKWMSIAIGDSMTDAWAWVATFDDDNGQVPQLLGYRMSGLDAATVQLVESEEQNALFAGNHTVIDDRGSNGRLSFEVIAQWPLPGMDEGETTAPLIWAVGPSWRGPAKTSPQRQDEHSTRSKAPTTVDFVTGGASAGKAPNYSMLLAHGALMWLAWLVAAPLTCAASRYVRNDPCLPAGPLWIQLHKAGALAAVALTTVGLILAIVAVSTNGISHIVSAHSKMGVAMCCILFVQAFFGVLRPPADDPPVGGFTLTKRRVWELSHRIFAVTMLAVAVAAVVTGSNSLEGYDSRARYGVQLSVAWIIAVVMLLVFYELRKAQIASAAMKSATPEKPKEEEEALSVEDQSPKPAPEVTSQSPWISSWWLVYFVPSVLGIVVLVIFTALTFSGQVDDAGTIMETEAAAFESIDVEATPSPTGKPTAAPYIPGPLFNESETAFNAPERCGALPLSHVGDKWCDDFEPFNTMECNWDGGDCCDNTAALYNCRDPQSPNFGSASIRGWTAPLMIPRNPRYTVTRDETLESFVISYNNYYEFGLTKDVVAEANKHADFLAPESWYVDISGLVENPMTLDVASMVNQMQLEERMYRHRCVEAWSITVPWVGFPLSKILDMVRPKPEAAIVQFVSWKNFTTSPVQASSSYPWPYTEALTIEEARNELSMVTVGAFGKPLTPQQGAPIRLNLPWKYGFKSIKSIEKITFRADDSAESRRTFWSETNFAEYGFYANVNPEVPHRRWSQASERHYVVGNPPQRIDTTRMNGYQAQVDYLYEDEIDDPKIYF